MRRVGCRWSRPGTGLGLLLALDVQLNSENVWMLFPVWQASIAWIFFRTLQNAKR